MDKFDLKLKVIESDQPVFDGRYFGTSGDTRFDNCFAHLYCYDLARDEGRWFPSERAVVIRRFQNHPRYRVYNIRSKAEALLDLARRAAEYSYKPVAIKNLPPKLGRELLELHPEGKLQISVEAVLQPDWVLQNIDTIFVGRDRSTLRKSMREMEFDIRSSIDDQIQVVDHWKKLNASKHFRLSITRDYVSIKSAVPDIRILGKRNNYPTALHLIAKHPAGYGEWAIEMVEKSLNYSTFPDGTPVPGGKYGTSDANFVVTCEVLQQLGIKYFNLGTFDGGNPGLGKHKLIFCQEEDQLETAEFLTAFEPKGAQWEAEDVLGHQP